jgi:hypothetical protein
LFSPHAEDFLFFSPSLPSMVSFWGRGFVRGGARHGVLPHHDLRAVGGDPLQLGPILQHHLLHKLDGILQP